MKRRISDTERLDWLFKNFPYFIDIKGYGFNRRAIDLVIRQERKKPI